MSYNTTFRNIAVIILNYNTPAMTLKAVQHLRSFGTELQIIVVDNCSTDDSKDILQSTLAAEPCVHFVLSATNSGYASGNNIGINYARGLADIEYIVIMNPDVIVDISVLAEMKNTLAKNGNIGQITAETYYNGVYRIPNDCAWRLPTLRQLLMFSTLPGYVFHGICKLLGVCYNVHESYHFEHYQNKAIAYVEVVQGCFFMCKLTTMLDIGMLDDATFLYYEENILGAKIRARHMRNAVLVGHYFQHNHQEKDKSLLKAGNKIFHMTCLHNSRKHYIKQYLQCSFVLKKLLLSILDIDFEIRKLGVKLLLKN